MSSANQKTIIQNFSEITGYNSRQSQSILRKYNFDVSAALDAALKANDSGNPQKLNVIFDQYAGMLAHESGEGVVIVLMLIREETSDEIGIDGTIRFITDLGLALEDPVVLCIAYQLEAKEMGKFTRSGFVKGWSMAKCSSISDMRNSVDEMKNSMDRDDSYFSDVYKFTFAFNLNDGQRLLPQGAKSNLQAYETAIDYWNLLLPRKFPLLDQWVTFVSTIYKRNISKDTWNMIWDFAKYMRQDPDLVEYDEEGAWPSAIDEFVEYLKQS